MIREYLRAGLYAIMNDVFVIGGGADLITGPNPPKGKGKFQHRLDDKRAETPVKSKSLKRLLKQKGRK